MRKGRSSSSTTGSSDAAVAVAVGDGDGVAVGDGVGEPTWRLRFGERLKLRLRGSADDSFAQRPRPGGARGRKAVRRRHTMGGQRDFEELAAAIDCHGDGEREADLSAVGRLKPRCSSQDFSFSSWIARERRRGSQPRVAPKAVAEDDQEVAPDRPPLEHANGKKAASVAGDAHPHKLSGAQVVRSRFYQYL